MPRFTPDFSSVDASIPTYPKGRYQVKVTGHTPFARENRDGKFISGVRYNLEMIGQYDSKGKLQRKGFEGRSVASNTLWTHTDRAFGINKQFLMAAAGFQRDEEEEANEKFFTKHDWDFAAEPGDEGDAVELGGGWDQPIDSIVDVNMDIDVYEGNENQSFSGWSPPAE